MSDKNYRIKVNGLHVLSNKGTPNKYTEEEAKERKQVLEAMMGDVLKIEIEIVQ